MTKKEAQTLELACDKIFSDALGEDCHVSRALIGCLSICFGDNFVNISHKDLQTPTYVKFSGDYDYLQGIIIKIQLTIRQNRERIELLMKSYNMRLED